LGGKIREYKLWYEGQVVRCLGVVFNGTGWGYGWIVNTGIHRAGSFVAWGRLQLGDQREPGCSRDAGDKPGPRSRGTADGGGWHKPEHFRRDRVSAAAGIRGDSSRFEDFWRRSGWTSHKVRMGRLCPDWLGQTAYGVRDIASPLIVWAVFMLSNPAWTLVSSLIFCSQVRRWHLSLFTWWWPSGGGVVAERDYINGR
jgi:hypothetical protein